jgi:hypothetical protein
MGPQQVYGSINSSAAFAVWVIMIAQQASLWLLATPRKIN